MTLPKRPRDAGLPLSLTAAQTYRNVEIAKQMDEQRKNRRRGTHIDLSSLTSAATNPFGSTRATKDATAPRANHHGTDVSVSYRVENTTPSNIDLTKGDIAGQALLDIEQIDPYEGNPRKFANESRDEIKAAIVRQGLTRALVVTRRRVGDRFMLAAGSNTTLSVLKELWTETHEKRFQFIPCVVQEWQGDARIVAQHLGENLNRGDMKFYEVATGMMRLVELLEEQRRLVDPAAKPLSQREMVEAITTQGLKAEKTAVARWQFTVHRLASLGEGTRHLTSKNVGDVIQLRLHALRGLAAKFGIAESSYWGDVVDSTLAAYAASLASEDVTVFDPDGLCTRVEATLAERVSESLGTIRQMLSALKLVPDLTLSDLRAPSPSIIASPPAQATANPGPGSDATAESASTPSPGIQRPLPLRPGVVRNDGQSPAPASPAAARAPRPVAPAQAQPTAHGPLFGPSSGDAGTEAAGPASDPLHALHERVVALLDSCGLSDTLRWWDELPLGFFVDLPTPEAHPHTRLMPGSAEHRMRAVRNVVWWQLVFLTGQTADGCVPYMDKTSAFFLRFMPDDGSNPLLGTDIDIDPPEFEKSLLLRLAPGDHAHAMDQLVEVEQAVKRMYAALPDRWSRMKTIQNSIL